ncbi:hypothetical protein [Comamonas sp. JC664]|uniref:hypothetical protein n=1 Tax=Comamonas sp. JC664 TaxID=2801917 RepID=UPI003611CF81
MPTRSRCAACSTAARNFQVDGYHLSEPRHSARRAAAGGSSGRGLQFAARHAECVFMAIQDKAATAALVRQCAPKPSVPAASPRHQGAGGHDPVVAATARQAQEKYQEYCRYASPEARAGASVGHGPALIIRPTSATRRCCSSTAAMASRTRSSAWPMA